MWSRKHDGKSLMIFLHVVEVSGAVFISILAPLICLVLSEYRPNRFPPVMCTPSKTVYFYTTCLPLCAIEGSGSILLIILFWTLIKVS